MNPTRMQTQAVQQFKCLAAECPDTCCAGWGMQVTSETIRQYEHEAPELLAAVEADATGFAMKRDALTTDCVKFERGLCAIQREYSEALLGDACYFFPRITRSLGTTLLTTMTLACPEAARLMLYGDAPFTLGQRTELRIPYILRNYLPAGIGEGDSLAIHAAFMQVAGEIAAPPAQRLMRISAVARALEMQPHTAWPEAVPFYIANADQRIPPAKAAAADLFNLAHALHGLAAASQPQHARFHACLRAISDMLGIHFPAGGEVMLAEDAAERAVRALAVMRQQERVLAPVLGRYLEAQISESCFPFAGFGHTLSERITIIGVRYATMRLALATLGAAPAEAEVVRVIQSLSRFIDHLADPALSLLIYRETGWGEEPRLRAIIGA